MEKTKQKRGFSLVEFLIDSSISMVTLALVTSFLWTFYNTSTFDFQKEKLKTNLINIGNTIDREIKEGSNIIYQSSSFTTNNNTLILSVPSYDEKSLILYDPVTMLPKTDLIIFNKIDDGAFLKRKFNNNNLRTGRLKLKIIPASNSIRKAVSNIILTSELAPGNSEGKYLLRPDTVYSSGVFTYFTSDKSVVVPSLSNIKNITSVKVSLIGEIEYGKKDIISPVEFEIKLRNIQGF